MKKPFIKILTILSIIFISFFAGEGTVLGDGGGGHFTAEPESSKCYWISPLTYMNEYGLPSNVKSQVEYESDKSGYKGKFGPDVSETVGLTSYRLKYNGSKFDIGYSVEELSYLPKGASLNEQGGYNIYLDETYSTKKNTLRYDVIPDSDTCSNYKYASVVFYKELDGYKNVFKITLSGVEESEYINYLKSGGQYKKLFDSKKSYGTYDLYTNGTKNDFTGFSDQDYDKSNKYTFGKMIEKTGGEIILVNSKAREKYPNTQWNKFVDIMKKGGMDEKTLKSKLEPLNIDTGDYNSKTYNRIYYDATKTNWEKYMANEFKNQKVGAAIERNEYFIKWFENVSRYIFEEDVSQFKKYFDYLYSEKIASDNDYKSMSDALEGMCEVVNVEEVEMNCLEKDPCSPYCNGDITEESEYICSGSAFNACANGSAKYKSCTTAYKKCSEESKKNCQKLGIGSSEALETCVTNKTNDCVKKELGTDQYTELKNKQTDASKVLEKRKQNAQNKVIMNIHNISLPSTNINYKYKYKVKCEDFEALHTIYLILEIAAPTAVIVFGSLDYAKAVMSSDIEKMEKSKKKFPKRLLLLVLFILVPILIQIMLNLFSKTNDSIDVNTSLMKCIILGK